MQYLILKSYLEDLFKTSKLGDAREESYYTDLKNLLISFAQYQNKNFSITVLPKKTEAGNPDFRVWDGKGKIVGYIEAKDPKTENLDSVEDSEQLKRYLTTFPNVILTNFFEFRLYRDSQLIEKVQIGRPFIIHQLQSVPPAENEEKFITLLEKFFAFSIPKTITAKALAIELAKRARFLRDNIIAEELKEETMEETQTLEGYFEAFKKHLVPSLTLQDFSNLFSQTIVYGLFAARTRADEEFSRKLAYHYIPHTIGILRDVFRFISSSDLPQKMEWITDDIAEVLEKSNVKKIMENFYKEGKGRDPIVHFYETFLAEYDPKEREKRGVYYTPESIVGYIARSIHKLLKEKFKKEDGFATQSVIVLDPAAGTLTFPAEAIRLAIDEFKNKYGDGGIGGLIKSHILKNFYAFELMMAPYAIGHLKIGFIFNELGYRLTDQERFNLYLTNTLDFTKENPSSLPGIFERSISKESQEALKIKEEIPTMVVMGNPPYSVSSSNVIEKDSDFKKLYESYKEKVRKEERNIQPLSDDYIKFLAFAHWKVKQAGQGIVGMITNNSYLDGLIHRDMRKKLLDDFEEIYVLNLHGSTKRQEKIPEGGKDENVFDIQQGVSIILLIKSENLEKFVKYADVWGLREKKYEYLEKNDIFSTKWVSIKPQEPHNFFTIKDFKGGELYDKYISLVDIFNFYSVGGKPGDDNLLVSFDSEIAKTKLQQTIYTLKIDPVRATKEATRNLLAINNFEVEPNRVIPYNYRPFDVRFTYYDERIYTRPVLKVKKQFDEKNIALLTTKILKAEDFAHAFVTNLFSDVIFLSNKTSTNTFVFPLYLYKEDMQQSLLNEKSKSSNLQWSNLPSLYQTAQPFTSKLSGNFIQTAGAIFYYIYAILYSNTYRQKYQEFLKIDFPRIPFTKDYQLFQSLAQRGEELVELHLLKSKYLEKSKVKFYGKGSLSVEMPSFTTKVDLDSYLDFPRPDYLTSDEGGLDVIERGIIKVNQKQFFGPINKDVWNYNIGGYQVLEKWLKDRRGRILSSEDVKHYCKVATALSETIEIQKEIDRLYLEVEKSLIKTENV